MTVLVIGYGNPLRADDGLGWHAAAVLACDARLAGARVLQRHQLTPELAVDIAESTSVIFVDARAAEPGDPGDIRCTTVTPVPAKGAWTHHTTPQALLGIAAELSGRVTPAFLVTAPAPVVEVSDRLSPTGEALLPALVERVALVGA